MMTASEVLKQSFLNPSIESSSTSVGSLAAGQPVTLTIAFPPPLTTLVPAATGIPAVSTPLFSAGVTWNVYSDSTKKNLMIEGQDYLILSEGGMSGQVLSLVFNPPLPGKSSKNVYIEAKAVATSVDSVTSAVSTSTKNYNISYQILPVAQSVLDGLIQKLLDLLYVGVPHLIINPGEVVTARVAQRKAPGQPQLVTSLVHDAPSVDIRGSIPLDNILNFILAPFRLVSSVIPGTNPLSKTNDVTANIKKLAQSALTVPVRLNITGQRLATAYKPIGDMMPISFSRTPDESGDFQGFLPLGQWPLPFSIPNQPGAANQAGIEWVIIYTDSDGKSLDFVEPTVNLGMLRNILFFPPIQALGTPLAPAKATIKIKPYINIGGTIFAPPSDATLPNISLDVLPLSLPEVVACIENEINLENPDADPGNVILYVSTQTGTYAGAVEDFVQLMGNLSAVLNTLISILSTAPADDSVPQFTNLVYLNRSIKLMNAIITKRYTLNKSVGYGIAGVERNPQTGVVYQNATSIGVNMTAFIAISPRTLAMDTPQPDNQGRRLRLEVAPPQEGANPYYSSYVPSLNVPFSSAEVTPENSTVPVLGTKDANYNNQLRYIKFDWKGP
jgi:hypothetical protein